MANNSKLTVTGTGDSLFVSDLPKEYDDALRAVADFINSCDVKLTNLETNLSDFEYYAGAYSGGTWLNTRRACLDDLLRYGFNYYGNANNHAFDYFRRRCLLRNRLQGRTRHENNPCPPGRELSAT